MRCLDLLGRVSSFRALEVALIDHRKLPRVRVKLKAHYTSASIEMEGTIMSISEAGLFLYSARLDPEGTPARLEFPLNGGRTVRATGEVIYTGFQDGLRGMGIRFNRLVEDDRQAIQRLLREGKDAPRVQ